MNSAELLSQVSSLELQLAVLKAQLRRSPTPTTPKTAAELYGICAGQSETTDEDFEAVEYRPKWDGRGSEGQPG